MADQAYPDVSSSNALIPPASDGVAGGTINAPELNVKTLRPKRRAISNVEHIFQIISTLEEARRDQNEKNGRIMAKYNAERPYEQAELKEEGQDWRSNFSTKPLSTAIDKVSPRLTKAVQTARYLTSSSLPENHPGGKEKSEMFRRKVTEVIRGWDGWVDFLNEVSMENALFGFTSVGHLDEYSWRPTHFRQDEFFVPDGTKQNVNGCQLWVGKQYLMIHELASYIENRDAAETAGWDIENTVGALNAAAPRSVTGGGHSSPYTDFRVYEDAIRESSVSLSLLSGSKTIEVYHIYVPEYDGKVSHYVVDGRAKKILFEKLDQFDSAKGLKYVLSLFSFQQANGKLMGSKGIGRELYELAGAVDRARNEVVDRLQLSGKIMIQGDAKQLNRFALAVQGMAVLIPANYTISEQKNANPNVEAFLKLDQQLVAFMDQIAGGVTPKEFGNERTTASEVNLFAARQEEKRDAILERFLMQVGKLVDTCQKRIVSKDTDDEDAEGARAYLLNYMSEEELELIANQPALRTVDDWTDAKAQQIVLFAAEKRQDPLFDQEKLQKAATSARVNAEFAEDVMLPIPDPTVVAEQTRQQNLENILLSMGDPVEVSPRDNHGLHIEAVKVPIVNIGQKLSEGNPGIMKAFEQLLIHWEAHISAAVAAGADKAAFAEDLRQLRMAASELGNLQAIIAQQAQQAQQAAPQGQQAQQAQQAAPQGQQEAPQGQQEAPQGQQAPPTAPAPAPAV